MSDSTLKFFAGMNNRRKPSDLSFVDRERRQKTFLRDAQNVDLSVSGTLARRAGYRSAAALEGARSLWSEGSDGYFAAGLELYRFDGTNAPIPVAALTTQFAEVSFTRLPQGLAWTDGYQTRLLVGDTDRALGVPQPSPVPTVSAAAGGSLKAGQYMVAFAAVADRQMSPMSPPQTVVVAEGGTIAIASPAQVRDVRVFITACDGSTLYLEAILFAGQTAQSVPLVQSTGHAMTYETEAAMPPGSIMRRHNGRLLVASGAFVTYSNNFNFSVCNPARNYVQLDGEITLMEPVEGGVYLATEDKTWFAPGGDFANPDSFECIAPYGAVPGTSVADVATQALHWFTPRGLVQASPNGKLELLQDENLVFGGASGGASILREQSGHRSIVSALRQSLPAGTAISSSFMDAEVFKE